MAYDQGMKRLALILVAATTLIAAKPIDDYPAFNTTKKLWAKTDFRGKAAPKFEVEKWLSGEAPDFKGKVLVVDFWATWCGPCKKLIPEMNDWAAKFKNDVVFIGVSDEPEATVSDFMKTTKMNYNVAIDTKKRMNQALGVEGIPHVMVVTPDGVVRWQGWPQDDADLLTEKVIGQIVKASKAR